MAGFKSAGQGATMWAVLIFLGVLVIIGIIAWIRRTQHPLPTSPANSKPTSVLQVPIPNCPIRLG